MFKMSTRRLSRSCGVTVVVATLFGSASAYAAYSTPARPDAIEQAASSAFGGAISSAWSVFGARAGETATS